MRKYNIYATLLDTFQNYLDSDKIYSRYWGNSENPPRTPKEFEQLQYQAVLDRINRMPFDSDAADRGTCFNEIIDCIVERRKSDKMELLSTETTIKTKCPLGNGRGDLLPVHRRSKKGNLAEPDILQKSLQEHTGIQLV